MNCFAGMEALLRMKRLRFFGYHVLIFSRDLNTQAERKVKKKKKKGAAIVLQISPAFMCPRFFRQTSS